MAEVEKLNLIYAAEFGEKNYSTFKLINFEIGAWGKDLKDLIDDKTSTDLTFEMIGSEKPLIVARFLTQQNSVPKYKQFISMWKKYEPARAVQFEGKLKNRIENAGLTKVDQQFLMKPTGMIFTE